MKGEGCRPKPESKIYILGVDYPGDFLLAQLFACEAIDLYLVVDYLPIYPFV